MADFGFSDDLLVGPRREQRPQVTQHDDGANRPQRFTYWLMRWATPELERCATTPTIGSHAKVSAIEKYPRWRRSCQAGPQANDSQLPISLGARDLGQSARLIQVPVAAALGQIHRQELARYDADDRAKRLRNASERGDQR